MYRKACRALERGAAVVVADADAPDVAGANGAELGQRLNERAGRVASAGDLAAPNIRGRAGDVRLATHLASDRASSAAMTAISPAKARVIIWSASEAKAVRSRDAQTGAHPL
jgi:hypothetical protein